MRFEAVLLTSVCVCQRCASVRILNGYYCGVVFLLVVERVRESVMLSYVLAKYVYV